jgi:hypothetical protein
MIPCLMSEHYEFTWPQLLGLTELFTNISTLIKIESNHYIAHKLIRQKRWIQPKGNSGNGWIIPFQHRSSYKKWYLANCETDVAAYRDFLNNHELPLDGRRPYTTIDLDALIVIALQKDNILENIDQVTLEMFSSEFFGGSKYLKEHKTVRDAVLKILGLNGFKGQNPRDHLWRLVVDCPDAEVVVLCENKDFLRIPDRALEAKIELWYVGGNNMGAINRISADKLKLPLYYSCDWDRAGLDIFIRICKRLFDERVDNEKRKITLLYPTAVDDEHRFPTDSPNHKSEWDYSQQDSGLDLKWFSNADIKLFRELISADQWIEEQKNDLIKMVTRARSN